MDPDQNHRPQQNHRDPNPPRSESSENPNLRAPERVQEPQPQSGYTGYTVIPPNQSRRNNLTEIAQREEQQFQTFRDARRSAPVHMTPARLGGSVTQAEAREQQSQQQRASKLQKKLKIEEDKKRRKEEEERKEQEKKDIQRAKAEKLEQKKKRDQERRREQFEEDRHRVTDRFLQGFEQKAASAKPAPSRIPEPVATSSDTGNVRMSLEEKQRDHKRTNAQFLDRVERQTVCGESSSSSSPSPPEPESCRAHTAADASGPDFEWALMKLMSNFPQFDKDVLQDLLRQCDGDYEETYNLLAV
ncbi:epithelial-stromal interaction protein 1 isoform X1 [Periophthalmus magnuspinnatus]|uniref:epithelial-stromal interaction protein 1 isoform X1 n=1 Tax=Periophthalmus magnuspinnatus TaxID=409849 RepID=UPI00145AF279|nr:epithelial-stromal interaction protein 1 isoform X1 [Periophthalmus magnuspinnatus]